MAIDHLLCGVIPKWNLKNGNIIMKIPATPVDFVFATIEFFSTCFFSDVSKVDVFSWVSGRTIPSDGTRAPRSGGWSFPTGGLAYNTQNYIKSK